MNSDFDVVPMCGVCGGRGMAVDKDGVAVILQCVDCSCRWVWNPYKIGVEA